MHITNEKAPAGQGRGLGESQTNGRGLHRDSTIAISAPQAPAHCRRCPYFAEVQAAPRNVFLFAGPHAWDRAKRRREQFGAGTALLLPPGEDPATLRWPAVAGGVLVDARALSRQDAVQLAACVVRDGTPMAYVIGDTFGFPVASPHWRNPLNAPRTVAA